MSDARKPTEKEMIRIANAAISLSKAAATLRDECYGCGEEVIAYRCADFSKQLLTELVGMPGVRIVAFPVQAADEKEAK